MDHAHTRSLVWFATGIALTIAVTVMFASWRAAAVGSDESTFVPITPCRLVDTRPGSTVGPKSSPIGPNEAYPLQVTGNQGNCTIPAGATAVAINLVGISPSANTFLSIYPDDAANPGTAVINMLAGQAPTPNKIDVKLSPAGRVKVFNKFGNIHIVGDVLGYYRHDGLADLEARVASLEATLAATPLDEIALGERTSFSFNNLTTTSQSVTIPFDVPAAGTVTLTASCWMVNEPSATTNLVQFGLGTLSSTAFYYENIPPNSNQILTARRTFQFGAASNETFRVTVRDHGGANGMDCTNGSFDVTYHRFAG